MKSQNAPPKIETPSNPLIPFVVSWLQNSFHPFLGSRPPIPSSLIPSIKFRSHESRNRTVSTPDSSRQFPGFLASPFTSPTSSSAPPSVSVLLPDFHIQQAWTPGPKSVFIHPTVAEKAPIAVVCAVIEDSATGRVLIAQRPAHKHLALKWEFPGGKVEAGESPEPALLRELREELGCDALILRALPRFTHDYGTVLIEMFPFVCHLAPASPAPNAREHLDITWVVPANLETYDLAPADWPVVAAYRETPNAG